MQYFMDRLINKAIQNSQTQRVAKLKVKTWSPDIVISRDPGSGGKPIAQKLAKKLGWQFFGKELMLKLAKELDIPEDEFAHIDEHSRSFFADLFHSVFNPSYVSDIHYINHLKHMLTHAAKGGDMVILGRGANLILPPDKCLRVRITASFEQRVKNTYQFEGNKTKEEAAAWVRHVQTRRNQFIRQYFGVNPHNPWNYDLVISTDHLTIDQATQLIIQAYFIKFPEQKRRQKSVLS